LLAWSQVGSQRRRRWMRPTAPLDAGRFTDPDAGAASDPTFARALTNHHRW